MADHKAPTEVTIASHEEKSGFAEFVDKHWMKGALVAILISGFILFAQWQRNQEAGAIDESWKRLMSAVEADNRGALAGDPDAIAAMEGELAGTIAGPWALYMKAQGLRKDGRYDEAVSALQKIKELYPDHPLVKDRTTYGESETPLSTVEHLSKAYNAEAKWKSEQPGLFGNPDPASGAPTVKIQTDYGDIVVALYEDRAPTHTANMIKLVNEGFYNGIKFHRTGFGQMIEAGDPQTKDDASDPMEWGKKGAENTLEVEETELSHFEGYLAALSLQGEEGSNGSLFGITAQAVHYLDGQNVVFGKVIEGMDVVQEIASLPLDETRQRPRDPVIIQSMTVVPGA